MSSAGLYFQTSALIGNREEAQNEILLEEYRRLIKEIHHTRHEMSDRLVLTMKSCILARAGQVRNID
ncbi:hypothetical protein SeMB42_g07440 [Synchytrium endobioticum]|uniref:Uncharacterized protein n=1 Tax=Synchytrium endobioticum TaxID=286115 RepID=A0A507CM68_9FUNG|nr:hypothetical protein SeMB42_g07440 [Synchytrium endobioticum]TPX39944.1 hypothetical protein SeLEV6574_g06905 [Synchytrium endobioticum]